MPTSRRTSRRARAHGRTVRRKGFRLKATYFRIAAKVSKAAPKGCGPLETRGVFKYRFALCPPRRGVKQTARWAVCSLRPQELCSEEGSEWVAQNRRLQIVRSGGLLRNAACCGGGFGIYGGVWSKRPTKRKRICRGDLWSPANERFRKSDGLFRSVGEIADSSQPPASQARQPPERGHED